VIRVGIVGCGFIGSIHSFALECLWRAGLVDAAVTATFDVDTTRAARLATRHGAAVAPDLDTLVAQVDAVWVCTWTAEHAPVVDAAVAARRAVFCEKPLAPSLAGCERVAAALTLVPHQVGLVLRSSPVLRAAVDAVASGRYGAPVATILRDDQYFPNQGMYASDWRADVARAGGGTLLEHSIHDVDVLRWLLGDPLTVAARVVSRAGHPGIDDAATVVFGYAEDATATLVSVWHQVLTRGSSRRLEVFCEEAFLWTDDDNTGPLHVETSAGAEVVRAEPPAWVADLGLPEEHASALAQYATPMKAFLDALASGAPPAVDAPDAPIALAAHRLVDLAYRSSEADGTPLAVVAGALTTPPSPPPARTAPKAAPR
jgi:1,5-anhydro-D-fructose reductase (1,5-anhydro-D-mannitol-forming)